MKYLVDVNLPNEIESWNNENFVYQSIIDKFASDNQIWGFAKKKDLIIITKDSDFTHRIMNTTPPPKVIQFKVGNLKREDFEIFYPKNGAKLKTKLNLIN